MLRGTTLIITTDVAITQRHNGVDRLLLLPIQSNCSTVMCHSSAMTFSICHLSAVDEDAIRFNTLI